ncbi:MAG: sulfite exporter TauE/SafE family protein [Clostridia bacterium]|nr:sulfite exporter TauE/SafE family protein [Clostridia bacterium]
MEGKKARIFSQVTCGVALGAANSLFGGGGGMIAVPMLQKTGLQEKNAHATAILLILPVSLLSFIFYVFRGFYDPNVLIPTAIGVTAGGLLGAALLGKMSVKKVSLLFSILQAAAGIFLLFFH